MKPGGTTAGLFVGIAREPLYSPGKRRSDRDILEATAEALRERSVRVRLLEKDWAGEALAADLVFAMCQGPGALAMLRRVEQAGIPVLHSAGAIEACHRTRLCELLAGAGLSRPELRVTDCLRPDSRLLDWIDSHGDRGVWVKRGDVHAVEPCDVVRVREAAQARDVMARLASRGVTRAVVEAHVEGRSIKFYGVRGTGFFRAYSTETSAGSSPQRLDPPRRDACTRALDAPAEWMALCDQAAAVLGLTVYGGDLVIGQDGRAILVDVNDWPSFSPCRNEAAGAIAEQLITCWRSVATGGAGRGAGARQVTAVPTGGSL